MRFARCGLVAASLIAGIGCEAQRPTARVSGRVLLDGKPLKEGAVVLMADDGSYQDCARIRPKGDFLVEAAPVGKVKVGVVAPAPRPQRSERGKKPTPPQPSPVPARYADALTSGLTLELVPGENTADVVVPTTKP